MAFRLYGKKCCTCKYWTGNRSIVDAGRFVEVNHTSDGASCSLPYASSSTKHIANQAACNKYEKMAGFKG